MKKDNKVVQFLVPVVAVVVLAESIMVISNLTNNKTANVPAVPTAVPTVVAEATQSAVYAVTVTGEKAMKLGQSGTVEVSATGNADESLDAVNVYLKYDPTAFDVSNLTFDKKLGTPAFSKVSQTTSLVVANFLISAPAGLKVGSGEALSLMKFSVKPIKTGDFDFEINTGSGGSEAKTMFVENGTSKILPFTANKLTVNVSR
jgi:hypothetical protein